MLLGRLHNTSPFFASLPTVFSSLDLVVVDLLILSLDSIHDLFVSVSEGFVSKCHRNLLQRMVRRLYIVEVSKAC